MRKGFPSAETMSFCLWDTHHVFTETALCSYNTEKAGATSSLSLTITQRKLTPSRITGLWLPMRDF